MNPVLCQCGHGHLNGGDQCWCGCTMYVPDDGTDGPDDGSCYGTNSLPGAGEYRHPAVPR